jgi:hypothetical protein
MKEWGNLGKEQAGAVSKFLLERAVKSYQKRRKFTKKENDALMVALGVSEDGARTIKNIEEMNSWALTEIFNGLRLRASKLLTDPFELQKTLDQLDEQEGKMAAKDYFPFKRFGKHIAKVIAQEPVVYEGRKHPKGSTILSEHFDTRYERNRRWEELKAEFSGPAYRVETHKLDDSA